MLNSIRTTLFLVGLCLLAAAPLAQSQTVTVEAIDGAADEVGDTATFRFTRTGSTAAALGVTVTFDGTTTATHTTDYSDNNSGFFNSFGDASIPAGQASFDVVLTPLPDNLIEGEERVDITLAAGSYAIGTPSMASFTIADNAPIVTLTGTDSEASELGDTATFTFSRMGGNMAASLNVLATFDGTTTATHTTDYSDNNSGSFTSFGTATIPAGQASFDVVLTPLSDNLIEGEERVDITLASGSYLQGANTTAGFTIADDAPVVTLFASDDSASEVGDAGTFTFSRTGGNVSAALGVIVAFDSTSTATPGTDYSDNNSGLFSSSGQASIPAGQTLFDLVITPSMDLLVEGEERIDITLIAGSYIIGSPDAGSITIADNILIFENDFELTIEKNACAISKALDSLPMRIHEVGDTVIDHHTGLEWVRCGIYGFYDWASERCLFDPNEHITPDLRQEALRRFNAGQLGDNAGVDDWRWATIEELSTLHPETGACLVRQY